MELLTEMYHKKRDVNRKVVCLIMIFILSFFIYDITTYYDDYIRIKDTNSITLGNQQKTQFRHFLEREFIDFSKRNDSKAPNKLMNEIKSTEVSPHATYIHEPIAYVIIEIIELFKYKDFSYKTSADVITHLSIVLGEKNIGFIR